MDGIQLNITTNRSLKRKASTAVRSLVTKEKKNRTFSEPATVKKIQVKEKVIHKPSLPRSDHNEALPSSICGVEVNKSLPDQTVERVFPDVSTDSAVPVSVTVDAVKETLFSDDSFNSLSLHPYVVKNISDKLGFTKLTLVQKLAIPVVQKGGDMLVKSQTGSGKTLVYALPIVNSLGTLEPPISRSDGVFCLVIQPTRELSVQCFDVFHQLCISFIKVTPGCLSGGEKKKSEKARIRKGINILVSTPGRLLDHLKTSANLTSSLSRLKYVVIDEADRLLESGFEHIIGQILNVLNESIGSKKWQTLLLSATLTPAVQRLVTLSLYNPEFIDVQAASSGISHAPGVAEPVLAVPEKLKQYYAITPTKHKLAALIIFLMQKQKQKILVFFPTQDVVEFVYSLCENVLGKLASDLSTRNVSESTSFDKSKLFRLHGEMKQSERSDVFRRFSVSSSGILFSTDVAARGLDLPSITWVVQFQAPETPAIYVHRVGRTARAGRSGSSIIFLIPNEMRYVTMMRQEHGMNLKSVRFSSISLAAGAKNSQQHEMLGEPGGRRFMNVIFDVQHALDDAINSDKALYEMARKAYISFVRAYATYRNDQRIIFNVRNGLHFGHVARSFGLKDETPTEINSVLRRHNSNNSRREVYRNQKTLNGTNDTTQGKNGEVAEGKSSSGGSYPMWKGDTYKRHSGGEKLHIGKSDDASSSRRGTKVSGGQRFGGRNYQVAMQRCSEFASG